MASIARLINNIPVPLFGTAGTAGMFVMAKAKTVSRMAGWAVPLSMGALWFVWPAVDDGWKIEMGLKADPAAAAKAAEEAAAAAAAKTVELPPDAAAKVEVAYKAHESVPTENDKMLMAAAASGDYTESQAKWEEFMVKSIRPGEDDDDDDEDDEDDDDDDDDDEDEDDDDE